MGAWLSSEEFDNKVLPTIVKLFASNDRDIQVGLLQHIDQYGESFTAKLVDEQVDEEPAIRTNTTILLGNIFLHGLCLCYAGEFDRLSLKFNNNLTMPCLRWLLQESELKRQNFCARCFIIYIMTSFVCYYGLLATFKCVALKAPLKVDRERVGLS
ncbi:hypothetical protein L1987_55228 [Smallanthus sonchifolius]|uniref:Uncharacterized protein n=1 Tax=Smallanthus sonchifolius TaxID=185202 RepID=A0ACB9E921_9ASTR|nr:hypothetical protein L1987_55228 [Smallanthus sonchifolius]